MPNEIDVAGLRDKINTYQKHGYYHDGVSVGSELLRSLPALLDEVELLRTVYANEGKMRDAAVDAQVVYMNRAEAAEREIERLRGERESMHASAFSMQLRAQAAEAERDALKAQLEKVREWAQRASEQDDGTAITNSPDYVIGECGDNLLAILDAPPESVAEQVRDLVEGAEAYGYQCVSCKRLVRVLDGEE